MSNVSAINKINSARASDKNNIPLSKTCALNKTICPRHHDTSIKSALNKINCAHHHDISTKSALSTMRKPVPVQLLSNPLPQNKVLFNNNNNNNSTNNKENNNGKIDIGTIPLPNTAKVMVNSVYQSKTAAQLQQYHHSIMGALPVKTYTAAIKEGWLSSFPGLSVEAVNKHLPKSVQTVMGQLHMIRKGIHPTPGEKTVEINKLMNEVMESDYDKNILHELPLN